MRTICIKTKINTNDIENVRAWFKILKERINETIETLKKEEVLVESAYLDKQGEDYFLIYYLKAKDIDKAYQVFNNSNAPIDLYFKNQWEKYCNGRIVLEELIDLETFEIHN